MNKTIMSSKISVIITTYNSPGYLARVLDGYLRQTRKPDEVLVADDGSTGDTAEIVRQYAKGAPFSVKHVWHEDQGFRAAKIRNEAVKVSNGSYLIFTDGDCIPHQAFVEDHSKLETTGWFIQGKRLLVQEHASADFQPYSSLGILRSCLRGDLRGCHHLVRMPRVVSRPKGLRGIKTCNLAVHKEAVLAVNGFNESFTGWGREDAEFAARLFAAGFKRMDPLFSALVFHLWHPLNSRELLERNDQLLETAVQSSAKRCLDGIYKEQV